MKKILILINLLLLILIMTIPITYAYNFSDTLENQIKTYQNVNYYDKHSGILTNYIEVNNDGRFLFIIEEDIKTETYNWLQSGDSYAGMSNNNGLLIFDTSYNFIEYITFNELFNDRPFTNTYLEGRTKVIYLQDVFDLWEPQQYYVQLRFYYDNTLTNQTNVIYQINRYLYIDTSQYLIDVIENKDVKYIPSVQYVYVDSQFSFDTVLSWIFKPFDILDKQLAFGITFGHIALISVVFGIMGFLFSLKKGKK